MRTNQKIAVVIPTIRNLDFLRAWRTQFEDYRNLEIIICEDHPTQEIKVPKIKNKIHHYAWQEIDSDLGKDGWIIPRRVSGIRNYGFLQAWRMKYDYIITLDDDCYPVKNHHLVELHLRNLNFKVPKHWTNTNPDVRHMYTRGFPYLIREEQPVMLSHGLWTNVLDHDGPTHLQHLSFRSKFAEHFLQIIPSGVFFPMCSMNLAFRREITPIMYFPLMGEDKHGKKWGYDRFDDIWCGIFAKKILDHLDYGVVNGSPFVEHRKASNPFKNLVKEAKGIQENEKLWEIILNSQLKSSTIQAMAKELIKQVCKRNSQYYLQLNAAVNVWHQNLYKT